jgi:hypothetical protein
MDVFVLAKFSTKSTADHFQEGTKTPKLRIPEGVRV